MFDLSARVTAIFSLLRNLALPALVFPSVCGATPVDYQFGFHDDAGGYWHNAVMGVATFTYDSDTHTFSNFLIPVSVPDYSLTHVFDFTGTANNTPSDIGGSRCAGSTTAAEQMFDFLSLRSCSLYGSAGGWLPWDVTWDGSTNIYIEASGGYYNNGYHVRQIDPSGRNYYPLGGAGFYGYADAIQAVNGVPEPGSLALTGAALACLLVGRRSWRTRALRQASSATIRIDAGASAA